MLALRRKRPEDHKFSVQILIHIYPNTYPDTKFRGPSLVSLYVKNELTLFPPEGFFIINHALNN